MCNNSNLRKAKKAKDDEFYTIRADVDNEMQHYAHHMVGKVIYCNCDTVDSAFVQYFKDNAKALGIKELLYSSSDFRGAESINLLKKADIVITNPPFSLFREYVAQLIAYDKRFLIIGNKNAIGYTEIFPLLKANKMWLGCTIPTVFTRPDGSINKNGSLTRWFTNLDNSRRHEFLVTGKKYYE